LTWSPRRCLLSICDLEYRYFFCIDLESTCMEASWVYKDPARRYLWSNVVSKSTMVLRRLKLTWLVILSIKLKCVIFFLLCIRILLRINCVKSLVFFFSIWFLIFFFFLRCNPNCVKSFQLSGFFTFIVHEKIYINSDWFFVLD